jgi:hypothetical protein
MFALWIVNTAFETVVKGSLSSELNSLGGGWRVRFMDKGAETKISLSPSLPPYNILLMDRWVDFSFTRGQNGVKGKV